MKITKSVFLSAAIVILSAATLSAQPNGGGNRGPRGGASGREMMQGRGHGELIPSTFKLEEAIDKMGISESATKDKAAKILMNYLTSVEVFKSENSKAIETIESNREAIKASENDDAKRDLVDKTMELSRELRPEVMKINQTLNKELKDCITASEYDRWKRYYESLIRKSGERGKGHEAKGGRK